MEVAAAAAGGFKLLFASDEICHLGIANAIDFADHASYLGSQLLRLLTFSKFDFNL